MAIRKITLDEQRAMAYNNINDVAVREKSVSSLLRKKYSLPNFMLSDAGRFKEAMKYPFYRYVAENGKNTCEKCSDLDGQVFPGLLAKVGVNFPPIHPNCKCDVEWVREWDEDKITGNTGDMPWYLWLLYEFGDKNEDYLKKFGKGNIMGGVLNLLGTTLDLPKNVLMNLSNAIVDVSHGNMPTYHHRMNYREYSDEITRKYGGKSPFDVLDELKSKSAAGSFFGGFAETLLEFISDPIFVYSIYESYLQSSAKTMGTSAYNEALSSGRILDKARANWNKNLLENQSVEKYFGDVQLITEPNKAYFWSGMGDEGADIAANIAKRNGGVTLETTIENAGVNMPKFDYSNPAAVQAWRDASAVYARQVSGEVRAIVGIDVKPYGIWNTVELPALKANPNVTKIIVIDPETLVETIIFTR